MKIEDGLTADPDAAGLQREGAHPQVPGEARRDRRRIQGDGEMPDLIRAHDWAETPLGGVEQWPAELVAVVNLMMTSTLPMQVFWGQEMILLYNDAMRVFLEGKHPQVLGKRGREAWAEAWPAVGAQLEGVLRDGRAVSFNHVFLPIQRRGVMEDFYWNYSYNPLYGPDGEVGGVLNIAQDVTAAVVSQKELEASEAQGTRILRSIGDAVIVTDADAKVTRMNQVAESLTGWSEREAQGRHLKDVFRIVNESTLREVESPAEKVRQTGAVVGLANHTLLVAKDGRTIPIDDSGAPIRDDAGNLTGIVLVFRDIEGRRAAEREREELTEQLQQVLAATTDAVVSVNRDWVMTYLNPVAEKMYGASGEVAGRRVWDAFPEAAQEGSPFLDHYSRAMDEKVAGSFEAYYPEPLNLWLRLEVYPTRDGIVVFSRDISAEKRTAEKLREKDDRLRMALKATNSIGTWDWDTVTGLVYVSEESANLYSVDPVLAGKGLPSGEFIKDVHPGDFDRLTQAIAEAMRTGEDYRCEYRLVQGDGAVRWVVSTGRCSLAADGSPLRFSGVTVDITELRRAYEALRASEASLRIAAETARLGTWELDVDAGTMMCSSICKANFGLPADAKFGYSELMESIHPEDRAEVQAAVRESVQRGGDYRAEYRAVWPDGTVHWIVASGRMVQQEQGESRRMAGVTMDVTDRHRTQAALMQSEKLAAVGRLAASIAHEINNPLESVTNLLYLARNSGAELPPEVEQYLDTADIELRRVAIISNQTLRFYKQSTRPKAVVCEDLFGSVLSIFQGRLVNSGVKVERRRRAMRPVVCFDNEIRQVLSNLVGNAIDAMHPHGGRLLLRSRDAVDATTGRAGMILTVADTGPGISRPVLERIFEAFFTTKGIGGTGLGLWVTQEIVQRHHGRIRVRSSESPEHHGTVFTLFLPDGELAG